MKTSASQNINAIGFANASGNSVISVGDEISFETMRLIVNNSGRATLQAKNTIDRAEAEGDADISVGQKLGHVKKAK